MRFTYINSSRLQAVFAALLLCLSTGCSYQELALKPYAPVPSSCEAIEAEMQEIARELETTWTLRDAKGVLQIGLNLAVAAEAINPGFATLNIVLQGIQLKDQSKLRRLEYLGNAYEHRECWNDGSIQPLTQMKTISLGAHFQTDSVMLEQVDTHFFNG